MDLKADKKSLKALLSIEEQQFRIPPYQRPYSWTFEQVDDLWGDLLENAPSGHFLGSIVMTTEDEDRPLVIDGQQRLTTLMLLLAALRDECFARDMTKDVQRIEKRLTADDLAEGDAYFKFKTGSANWPVFRDFVLRGPHDPQRKLLDEESSLQKEVRSRNRPLLANLRRLRGHLAGHLQTLPNNEGSAWLRSFEKNLMEKVEIVVIEVRDLADAFLLFETLNDRGLQLSAADLLKSHVLGQIAKNSSDEDVDAASTDWDKMLESLGTQVDVSRFLRHYLLATVPSVRKEEVFGHFKTLVASRGATWVLDDLLVSATYYGEFETPSKVTYEPARKVLTDLQTLRARSCYIALLPARRYLSETDFVEFARLAEVVTFRYSSVVGLGTNDIERRYRDAAQLLVESAGGRVEDARSLLIGGMPDSEQFLASFQTLKMGRQYLLRYTLQRIEETLSYNKEQQLKDSSSVHIEHIMPQTLSADWRDDLGDNVDLHSDYVNRWGNLTLLFSGLNIPASNKSFADKKAHYAESQVTLTTALMNTPSWGVDEIEERQRWLGQLSDQVWPKPPSADRSFREVPTGTLAHFQAELGPLWEHVEPYCIETTSEELIQLSELLPAHLLGHPVHGETGTALSRRVEVLLAGWDNFDAAQRRIARGVTTYFLAANDAVSDDLPNGLDDDATVISAAERILLS